MIVLLDGLAGSFCQRFPCISFDWSPTWLLCWMPWPDHFATGLFSFLFICIAHDCFAGCLGRIILPKVSFHFFTICLPHGGFAGCLGRGVLPQVCLHFFSCASHILALLNALARSFGRGFLSFRFICLPDDCSAGCLGDIIFQCAGFDSLSPA